MLVQCVLQVAFDGLAADEEEPVGAFGIQSAENTYARERRQAGCPWPCAVCTVGRDLARSGQVLNIRQLWHEPLEAPTVKDGRSPVDSWLGRLSTWQYVAVMVGICALACAVEGVLEELVTGHLDLASLVRFWCVSTLMLCTVGVVQRRRRNRPVRR
jgi:hypothetical protein